MPEGDRWRLYAGQDDRWERFEEIAREIRASLRLTSPDGADVAEFLLQIDGSKAWWRWSDEPFDE